MTTPTSVHPRLSPQDRLIVALDFPTAAQALALTDRLGPAIRWVKVGLELFIAEGPRIVSTLAARGLNVFLDLKLHDIPNTVAGAVRTASFSGAGLLTLHASGGPAMLRAAADAADRMPHPPQLLAVTVLTSMDTPQLHAIGVSDPPAAQVARLASMAWTSGIHGFVCSSEEVTSTRAAFPDATLVIPGIRPAGAAIGDQKRVATPASAIAAGASFLVVGRPITQASDPAAATAAILEEIAAATG
ncbi:MAG: orotidine-5'-phosphate decarboxylase [Acidobacteriaceae bacterium]